MYYVSQRGGSSCFFYNHKDCYKTADNLYKVLLDILQTKTKVSEGCLYPLNEFEFLRKWC